MKQAIDNYCLNICDEESERVRPCSSCAFMPFATNDSTSGAAMLRVVEAAKELVTYDDLSVSHDCSECWPDGVPEEDNAAGRELAAALAELDGDRHA